MRKTVGDSDDRLPGEQFSNEEGYSDDPFEREFNDDEQGGF